MLAVCTRHENFSRAAAELGITPTAVSQRMRALEADVGKQLFRRHGPKLATTEDARVLGQKVDHALSLLRVAVDDCRGVKHPLRVTCAPTFAARWLVPRLGDYQALPDADAICLDTSQSISRADTFDVAIRSGVGPWDGFGGVRLLSERVTPMLSPKWIKGGKPITVDALLKIPLIPDSRWREWFELAGMLNATPEFTNTRFPNYELEMEAAVRGIGAALLPRLLYREPEAQGKLIAPFSWAVEGPASYWLIWAKESSNSHFVRWMKSQFAIETAN